MSRSRVGIARSITALLAVSATVLLVACSSEPTESTPSEDAASPPEPFVDTRSDADQARAAELAVTCMEEGTASIADEIQDVFVDTVDPGRVAGLLVDRPVVAPGESVAVVPFTNAMPLSTATWVEVTRMSDGFVVDEEEAHVSDANIVVGISEYCYFVEAEPDWPPGEYRLRIESEYTSDELIADDLAKSAPDSGPHFASVQIWVAPPVDQ